MLTKLLLIFKSIDYYHIKEKNFWLSQEWDDISNEIIDNTPRFVLPLIIAAHWYTYNGRPSRTNRRPHWNKDGNFYKRFQLNVYLGYYQLHFGCNLALLPYTTYDDYLAYKKANKVIK